MALPTTNLSLNAIHVEVGGTTGTQCSLNDADIRGIATTDPTYDGGDGINQTSGTEVSIGEFRNASNTPAETVSLSGTTGSPNNSFDSETSPTDAFSGWRFLANGTVQRINNDAWTQWQDGTEWIDSQDSPSGDYWIQATLYSGDAPTAGPTLGTWWQLNTTREWSWTENSDPPAFANTSGILTIKISSDSSGSPVLDTGYYEGSSTQTGGA